MFLIYFHWSSCLLPWREIFWVSHCFLLSLSLHWDRACEADLHAYKMVILIPIITITATPKEGRGAHRKAERGGLKETTVEVDYVHKAQKKTTIVQRGKLRHRALRCIVSRSIQGREAEGWKASWAAWLPVLCLSNETALPLRAGSARRRGNLLGGKSLLD